MIPRELIPSVVLAMLGFIGCAGHSSSPTDVKVMTFNVLCSFCDSSYDPWDDRVTYLGDFLARHDPDLVGLQELTYPEEVQQVLALRPGFHAVYFVGDNAGPFGLTDYPDATILYRTERFNLQEHGNYWLSDTPDVPWSTGWASGMQFARIVNWARFEDVQSGRSVLFVTTHFDANSPNQEHSAPLLLSRTEPEAQLLSVIVTGDFNSQPDSVAYQTLTGGVGGTGFHLTNSFDFATKWSIDTNQDPVPDYDVNSRIDHIFTAGLKTKWECPQWTVDMHVYGPNQKYPSDHFPIVAKLVYTAPLN